MRKQIKKALVQTILVGAAIHLIIRSIYVLSTGSVQEANLFRVLELHLIFPTMTHGVGNLVASYITILLVFSYFYYSSAKKKRG